MLEYSTFNIVHWEISFQNIGDIFYEIAVWRLKMFFFVFVGVHT